MIAAIEQYKIMQNYKEDMSSGVAAGWDVLLLCDCIVFMLCDVKSNNVN